MLRSAALMLALFLAACGSDQPANPIAPSSPVTPPPAQLNIAGLWTGTYSSGQIGSGQARLTLTRNGTIVGGTWSTTPHTGAPGGAGTASGTAQTTNSLDTFSLRLTPSDQRTCGFQVTVTVLAILQELLGDFVTVNCTVTASGVFRLTRPS